MRIYLAVDIGGTSTKVAAFDATGSTIAVESTGNRVLTPRPGWVERDMGEVWQTTVDTITRCLAQLDRNAIAGVCVVGHSDGLYLVDASGEPVRNAIQATDTRAAGVAAAYGERTGVAAVMGRTGTQPFAGSPPALARWLGDNEPEALRNARWMVFAKDWIRFRLTGRIATDRSDASGSFLDIRTGRYDDGALGFYGIDGVEGLLPELRSSASHAGTVTDTASAVTGIAAGTPVVVGAHDVDAAAIGLDAISTGDASVVAGTFSINQLLVDRVVPGPYWQVRSFVEPDRWLAMSTSPTSAANLTWFLDSLTTSGASGLADLEAEVATVASDPSEITYLPYLFGSPDSQSRASFVGIGSHHRRAHLLRAVMEGVVFGHRRHLEWLASAYPLPPTIRLSGGATRSAAWTQLFADGLARPIAAGDGLETARGAAVLAAFGIGEFSTLEEASRAMCRLGGEVEPEADRAAELTRAYGRFLAVDAAVAGIAEAEASTAD